MVEIIVFYLCLGLKSNFSSITSERRRKRGRKGGRKRGRMGWREGEREGTKEGGGKHGRVGGKDNRELVEREEEGRGQRLVERMEDVTRKDGRIEVGRRCFFCWSMEHPI